MIDVRTRGLPPGVLHDGALLVLAERGAQLRSPAPSMVGLLFQTFFTRRVAAIVCLGADESEELGVDLVLVGRT